MTCTECGRESDNSGRAGNPRMAKGMCVPCYKRLVWYPANGAAVERNRESSRRWKREHLGQPGQPRKAA